MMCEPIVRWVLRPRLLSSGQRNIPQIEGDFQIATKSCGLRDLLSYSKQVPPLGNTCDLGELR